MRGLGTLINIFTVLIGGSLGLALGESLSDRLQGAVMRGLGLITLVIGTRMALETLNVFIPMASVVLGGLVGTGLGIEKSLNDLGDELKAKTSSLFFSDWGSGDFTKGFVTASLVFCVGPMTVLGAIEDGLTGNFKLLAIKAGLDGFAAMAFASAMGVGVLFSVLTLILYQGGLTFLAALVGKSILGESLASSPAINELSATGGILIIAIGITLLEIREMKVGNYLPAIFFAPAFVALLGLFGISL